MVHPHPTLPDLHTFQNIRFKNFFQRSAFVFRRCVGVFGSEERLSVKGDLLWWISLHSSLQIIKKKVDVSLSWHKFSSVLHSVKKSHSVFFLNNNYKQTEDTKTWAQQARRADVDQYVTLYSVNAPPQGNLLPLVSHHSPANYFYECWGKFLSCFSPLLFFLPLIQHIKGFSFIVACCDAYWGDRTSCFNTRMSYSYFEITDKSSFNEWVFEIRRLTFSSLWLLYSSRIKSENTGEHIWQTDRGDLKACNETSENRNEIDCIGAGKIPSTIRKHRGRAGTAERMKFHEYLRKGLIFSENQIRLAVSVG